MAEQFIGLVMLVTLNSPPDVQLRGKVSSVVAGQSLTLQDVTSPGNGNHIAEITIKATDVKDLIEAPKETFNRLIPPTSLPVPGSSRPKPFEDPAILSVGRRPSSQAPLSGPPTITIPPPNDILEPSITPAAVLVNAAQKLALHSEDGVGPVEHNLEIATAIVDKKSKKTPKKKQKKSVQQAPSLANGNDVPPPTSTPTAQTNRGKGWRQTPLLEPTSSFQPFSTLKKKSRKGGNPNDNGWATEDATDVQELGDFDFEGNLSKFDKRTVFEGIRADDMTAEEDRLVGHNRLPKPGTAGGKNLHYTENVLDHLNGRDEWKSEAGESDADHDNLSKHGSGSGRTSRRAESRLRPVQRKDGSFNNSQSGRGRSVDKTSGGSSGKSTFYRLPANKRCDVASALQMLNLENILDTELGLSEDMMSENAGRGIAEVALSMLNGLTAASSQNEKIQLSASYVVVCAGNNKSGQRAIAAGRHLRNHGVQVIACLLGVEREAELLESLRRQIKVFRSFGGKTFSKPDLMEYIKGHEMSVDLVIDGLLGLTISFEELRTGDQAAAYELIEWANRSRAKVLAIDIPTGIDPSSGKVSIIDGHPLYLHPDAVAAMGAPKKGLLQAMIMGEGVVWKLFLVDIGIADQAWKKAGIRMRRGVEFNGAWVIELGFKKGSED